MKVQVLVATMHQKDFSLHKKMNVKRDVLVANQCDRWEFKTQDYDSYKAQIFSSDTRGVGVNRNFALALADADILLFADDDVVYYDSELQGVVEAFRHFPDADMILFGLDYTRNGEIFEKRRCKTGRIRLWNALKFGACRMAVRKSSLLKHNLHFSTLFGGGAIYGSGEDSLFIRDCFRAGFKVYSYDYTLGTCAKDTSTWFTGFNEKYMFDKGAWIACAFPKLKHLVKWYFIWRFSKKTKLSLSVVIKEINCGIRAFRNLQTFEEAR